MNNAVSASVQQLARLGEFVANHMGLRFAAERQGELLRGVCSAAEDFGFSDPQACMDWLIESPPLSQRQIEILASHLTIGETYFFREKATFLALEEHVLPELIAARRRRKPSLRIWSAGCCTGEEPYSLAILLCRMLPDVKDWDLTIRATDINLKSLHKAREGVFGAWSFRGLAPDVRERYFTPVAQGRYQIVPRIRQMVSFDYLNLAKDTFPALETDTNAMDLILCRNVLIYFEPDRIPELIGKLGRSLSESGWLAVGATETSFVASNELSSRAFPGATLFRKRARANRVPPAGWPERRESPAIATIPKDRITPAAFSPPESPQPSATARVATAAPLPDPLAEILQLFEQGAYADAAERIETLLGNGVTSPEAVALAIRIHANLGDLDRALQCCQRAIADDALNAGFRYLRATILQEKGDPAAAAADLRRAVFLDPDFAMAHFVLGLLARRQGRAAESLRHLENTLRILRRCPAEERLAWSEGMTAGRLVETITSLLEQEPVS
jgi:chemotaxis protein methyltransferase CheR